MPSSKYYDPVKANEYYMRTRELKGGKKRSAKSDSTAKTSAAKKQVGEAVATERKAQLAALQAQNKKETDRMRAVALLKRTHIRNKLTKFMEQVSEATSEKREDISLQNQEQREKIAAERKAKSEKIAAKRKADAEKIATEARIKINRLPDMPKGLSRINQQRWRERRASEIGSIRGKANKDREKVVADAKAEMDQLNESTTKDREAANDNTQKLRTALSEGTGKIKEAARDKSGKDREAVGTELKNSLSNARAAYNTKRKALVERYKTISEQEKEKVSG